MNKTEVSKASINTICMINREESGFSICGKLYTSYDNVMLYVELVDKNNNVTTSLVDFEGDLSYKISIDFNIKIVRFIFKSANEGKLVITKPDLWCSKHKIYGNYQITINNKIVIRKRQFFDRFKNKFVKASSFKFYLVNFLSLFKQGSKIYFTDKDSELYKLYELDRDRSKVFISDGTIDEYKLLLLGAKRVITDKTIGDVVPFGKMTKKYIAASSFEIEIFNKEGENSEKELH